MFGLFEFLSVTTLSSYKTCCPFTTLDSFSVSKSTFIFYEFVLGWHSVWFLFYSPLWGGSRSRHCSIFLFTFCWFDSMGNLLDLLYLYWSGLIFGTLTLSLYSLILLLLWIIYSTGIMYACIKLHCIFNTTSFLSRGTLHTFHM